MMGGLIAGLVLRLAMAVAARIPARKIKYGSVMTYGWPYKAIAIVSTALVAIILWQLTLPENQSGLARRNAAIAIAITGTCAAWNWWLVRCVKYVVTPNEIIQLRRRHRWRRIKWKDVEMVSVSTGFDVRARDGRRIHVPYVVVGQKDFASEVLANVPRTRIDCLHVLEETLRE